MLTISQHGIWHRPTQTRDATVRSPERGTETGSTGYSIPVLVLPMIMWRCHHAEVRGTIFHLRYDLARSFHFLVPNIATGYIRKCRLLKVIFCAMVIPTDLAGMEL